MDRGEGEGMAQKESTDVKTRDASSFLGSKGQEWPRRLMKPRLEARTKEKWSQVLGTKQEKQLPEVRLQCTKLILVVIVSVISE